MTELSRTPRCNWIRAAACLSVAALIVGIAGTQQPTRATPFPAQPPTIVQSSGPQPFTPPPVLPQAVPPVPAAIDDGVEPIERVPRIRISNSGFVRWLRGNPPIEPLQAEEPQTVVEQRDLPPQVVPAPVVSRFPINIDPKTPTKDLLPTPPKVKAQKPSAFVDELAQVPELMLTEPSSKRPNPNKEIEKIAHQVAKINHLNREKKDRFVEALLAERSDLKGLPFVMGDACRMQLARSRHFVRSVSLVHNAMTAGDNTSAFLQNWSQQMLADDDNLGRVRQNFEDHVSPARIAAMMQICGPASENLRLGMAKYISSVSREESTRALVRIVLFSQEEEIRNAAVAALAARKEKDYTDVLLAGFRYPWPAVNKRAADALVKLDRKDVIPQLMSILDEPDPRAPVVKKAEGKSTATVRELVKINHHRNCLMCHAPGQDVTNQGEVLVAEVPVPGQPLPSFQNGGYQSQGLPEILVRIDVTYLRQDFSAMLPVADAAPWPEQQRFDFITRTRVLDDDELKQYQEKFEKLEPGTVAPNHKAALLALRELTGKDAAPTSEAWKKLLNK